MAHPSGLGSLGALPHQERVSQGLGRAEESPERQRHPGPAAGLPRAGGPGLSPGSSTVLRLPASALPALGLQSPFTQQYLFQEQTDGTSSVVQWRRVHLPMQGTQVRPPGPGRSHMLRGSKAGASQLRPACSRAHASQQERAPQ